MLPLLSQQAVLYRVGRLRGDLRCRAEAIRCGATRPAREQDLPMLRSLVLREGMNPLSLSTERFVVAEDSDGVVVGGGQLAPLGPQGAAWELRSLVVVPDKRGAGVGSDVARELLARAAGRPVYLLTISKRRPFYERLGFRQIDPSHAPGGMWYEWMAGTVVARIVAQDTCIAMALRPE